MIRLPATCHLKYSVRTLLAFLALVTLNIYVISSYAGKGELEQLKHDIRASFFHFLNIPTDTSIYPSEKDNVLWYSSINLRFLINNSKRCETKKPFVLIFVKTHPDRVQERTIIRNTWGDMSSWPQVNGKHRAIVLFVLGMSKTHTETLQAKVEEESRVFHDLIQVNFVEDFHNLTIKLISHLEWPLLYCRDAKFWMTTDDDVFVHVGNLVTHLKEMKPDNFYSGLAHEGSPRNVMKKSKYFVPYNVYQGSYFPTYFPGAGYVLSMDAVLRLYETVPKQPMLYIDDVYVGLLAYYAGIPAKHYIMFRGENTASTDLCTLSKFITSHSHVGNEMVEFFKMVMSLKSPDPNVLCWGKLSSWLNPHDIVYF